MSVDGYELLALLMRYIFVLIGALILWRAFCWLRRDARAYKKEMRALPDAGLIGEIVDLTTGENQPLPREGLMGSARECDIRLKGAGVRRRHVLFAFEEGKGVQITPHRGSPVIMAGVELKGPAHALHGTQIQLGDALIRVRLFAGLKVPHPSQFQMDMPDAEEADAPWGVVEPPPPYMPPVPAPPPQATYEAAEQYQGNYTEDGQMTWQYAAYPLEELRQAMQERENRAQDDMEEAEEALPYESPLPRRRRRSRR